MFYPIRTFIPVIHSVQGKVSHMCLALLQTASQCEHRPHVHITVMSGRHLVKSHPVGVMVVVCTDGVPSCNKDFCSDV